MAYYRTPHDVTALPAWQALQQHRDAMQGFSMREAFAADAQRFDQFSLSCCGLFLDYSKNLIDADSLAQLLQLGLGTTVGHGHGPQGAAAPEEGVVRHHGHPV